MQRCRCVAIVSLRCNRVAVCAMVQACFHGVMRQLVIGRFDEARYAPYAQHGPSPAWPKPGIAFGRSGDYSRRPRRLHWRSDCSAGPRSRQSCRARASATAGAVSRHRRGRLLRRTRAWSCAYWRCVSFGSDRWQVPVRRSVASRGTCEGNAQVGEVLLTSHEKMAQDWANVLLKHAQA